ncbi:MAG TPA: endonuclease/exonuclease/phosphatase family protein [Sphaerochaeta sp.]|nr:endonuclease/exonuclease/phosphatase family protein [Sphaerochaeta sp.]
MLILIILCLSLLCSCSCDIEHDPKTFRVLSYNVQNLFDARLDGGEYPEYQDPKVWNDRSYRMRLETLSKVLLSEKLLSPDVIILQEVEGPRVVEDLLSLHLGRKGYRWYAVAKGTDAAISVAVISRHPIASSTVHASAGIRPVLEATICTEGGDISLFALHAKSQIGDGADLRLSLAKVVSRASYERAGSAVLLCGDFNEDPSSVWDSAASAPALVDMNHPEATRLQAAGALGLVGDHAALAPGLYYCPYLDESWKGSAPGSCSWDGLWHRYDQILANGKLFDGMGWEYESFSIENLPSLCSSDGRPYAWNIRTLQGVSDHFPVLMTLKRR